MLISEVTEKETGIHPGHFAKSNLTCVDELLGAITQVNIDQLTLKMSDMHHVLSLQDSRQISAVYHQIFAFFLTFFTVLTLGVLFVSCAPICFKVKHRAKTCSFGSISPIWLFIQ